MDYFFSVIIPVYNTEKYLQECLDSVLSKKIDGVQVVCVNDGSTDGSMSILQEYQARNSNLFIISQDNQGLSGARNTGIKNADGKYILFLDSDDMLYENALEEMMEVLKSNDVEILLYDSDCMYETKRLKETDYKDDYYHRKKVYGGPKSGQLMFVEQMENDDFCDSACLMAISRQWLLDQSILFRSGMLYEDCLFVFQCFMTASKMMHINKALMIYRVREGSIMTSKPKYENVKSRMICYSEMLLYLLNHNLPIKTAQAVERFAETVMYHLKGLDSQLTIQERQKTNDFSTEEKLLAASLEIGIYKIPDISNRMLLMGFKERVKEAENIVIYGAGKIGTMVYRFLKENHLADKVVAFVVTGDTETREKNGLPLLNIEDRRISREVLLLISAGQNFQWDMLHTAYKNGFNDIEIIHRNLERGLEACK